MPIAADGRISAIATGVVNYYNSGGMPIGDGGRLFVSSGDIDHVSSGVPYTLLEQVKLGA
jgi:hypothetical protein